MGKVRIIDDRGWEPVYAPEPKKPPKKPKKPKGK
jgi:hypothetical protein